MIRVLLDTSTLRDVPDKKVTVAALRSAASSRDLKFSMMEHSLSEYVTQLRKKEVTFQQWLPARDELGQLIDWDWPIIPNGVVMETLLGNDPDAAVPPLEMVQRGMQDIWEEVFNAETWDEMNALPSFDLMSEGVKEAKRNWKNMFKVNGLEFDSLSSEDQQKARSETMTLPWKNAEDEFHYCLKNCYMQYMGMALSGGYTADNLNDAIDVQMAYYLPLPVIIVTSDYGFYANTKNVPEIHNQLLIRDIFLSQSCSDLWNRVKDRVTTLRAHLHVHNRNLGGMFDLTNE